MPIDPFDVLTRSKDPEWINWAINTLAANGFTHPEDIARDLGAGVVL